MTSCLACNGGRTKFLTDLGETPVLNGVTFDTAHDARSSAAGRLELNCCLDCGHVANVAYDPSLLDYDAEYDNSLHFSPTFQKYAEELARRLGSSYGRKDGLVVEIGSGKGDFLEAITSATGSRGVGYDPSTAPNTSIPNVTLVNEYYRPGQDMQPYDLLVCRHVLEHLEKPDEILTSLHQSAPPEAVHYFEVPAAEFDFGPDGLWDFIYPHISYFSRDSLHSLMHRTGFEILASGRSFSDQFHWVEVRAGQYGKRSDCPNDYLAILDEFAARRERAVERWRSILTERASRGESTALWGAGARGVAFLNAVDPEATLLVVDLNSRKWGRYLPGTGHRVVAPESLQDVSPTEVLITNPVYAQEIAKQLAALGVPADLTRV